MEKDIIRRDDSVRFVRESLNQIIEITVKSEARKMFDYMKILGDNVGNTLIVECDRPMLANDKWPRKDAYIVGGIGKPPIRDDGRLNSDGTVFLVGHDIEVGNYPSISRGNIFEKYDGFFPFHIWDLVFPKQFGDSRIPIKSMKVCDDFYLLACLERL